jgi:hypothetical protein
MSESAKTFLAVGVANFSLRTFHGKCASSRNQYSLQIESSKFELKALVSKPIA